MPAFCNNPVHVAQSDRVQVVEQDVCIATHFLTLAGSGIGQNDHKQCQEKKGSFCSYYEKYFDILNWG